MKKMDNEQIKMLFDSLKENFKDLKKDLKESIKEGNLEHGKINTDLQDLTLKVTDVENAIQNHLTNSAKSSLCRREKALLLFGAIGVVATIVTVIHKFM